MAKVQATMSTEIALDLVKASESIKSITNLVNSSTSAWKSQEAQLRATGDYLGATKAKYEGLGNSIQAQQAKIDALKQKQSELKGDTQQTAEQYLKFQQQIDQATTKLSSLEAQQNKAKQAMAYHESGLAELQKGYRLSSELSDSYVKRLQAEGRESEALQAKLNGSKTAVNNLNKQYEAQVKLLKEVAQSGDGDAYIKQKMRINETATALAKAKTEVTQLKNEMSGLNEKTVVGSNFLGSFKDKLSFGAIAGFASNAVQNLTSQISDLWQEAMQASDSVEKFESTMKFAGFGKKEIKEASKEFRAYADETVYELQDIMSTGSQLASNNIKNYKELAISAGNLNAVAGGNKETFKSLGMVMTQTAGAGKLTTENWNQLANAIPGASGILQKEMAKNGAYTGNFRKAMEEGQISSEELFKAIEKLGSSKGAEKAAKSTKTFEGVFGEAKASVVSGMNDVIKTIGKKELTDGIKGLSKFTKTAFGGLVKTLKYLKDHESTVKTIGSMMVTYFVASKIASGITAIKTATEGATLAQKAMNLAMKANPYVLVATAVVGIGVALYELYKHNKKFKGFVDGLVKSVKDFSKGVVEKFKVGFKAVVKAGKATIDFFKKDWKEILLFLINPVAGGFALIYKHNKKFKDFVDGIWKTAQNFGKTFWKGLTGFFGNIGKKLDSGYDKVTDFIGKIKSKTTDMWNHIKNGFKSMWDGMKTLAGNGINAVIKIPNAGISGINNLIADFGGSKNAISKIPEVKFATGTGLFSNYRRAITRPTLAVLNDGHDSPETGNQEAVIMPNGQMVLPQGQNSKMILPAGAEVLNATELKMLMSMTATPFAKGTGFWSQLWDSTTSVVGNAWDGIKETAEKFSKMLSFIGDAVKDPVGSLAKKFSPNADKLHAVFNPLGNALYKTPKSQAKNWWSELWSMAQSATDSGGSMSAVGDDYPAKWKAMGIDAMADPWGYFIRECVSFVANRLNNSGVNPALFSGLGNGNQWVNARVPHLSKPKVGSVAVYGPGSLFDNHVAMVTSVNGDRYSGEEYNWSRDGLYHTYQNRHASQTTTFLDFGLSGGSNPDDKPLKDKNSPLQTLIKKQVGGMFDWITKFLAPEVSGDPSGGGGATGVERWRSTVVKALKMNGYDATDSQVNAWMRVIQRESNGDPRAQNNWDSNAMAGIPSKGLVQTIEPTFNAYKFPGHNNIFNGFDNLLAGIAYASARYGRGPSMFARVSGPLGYANGGLVSKNGLYELAEGNMPEYVIPTDSAKRSRAWTLLAEVVGRFAGEAPTPQSGNSDSQAISKLEAKFDAVIGLLTQLVANGQQPTEIHNIIDGQGVSNALAPFMSKSLRLYENRTNALGGANVR